MLTINISIPRDLTLPGKTACSSAVMVSRQLWTSKLLTYIFKNVLSTNNVINKGKTALLGEIEGECGERVRNHSPKFLNL